MQTNLLFKYISLTLYCVMSVILTNALLLILQFMWCLSQISTSEGLRVGFLPPEMRQDIYKVGRFLAASSGDRMMRMLLQHINRKFASRNKTRYLSGHFLGADGCSTLLQHMNRKF